MKRNGVIGRLDQEADYVEKVRNQDIAIIILPDEDLQLL